MKLFSFLKNRKSLLLMAAAVLLSHLSMAQDAATTAAPAAAAPAEATQSLMQIFLILIVAVLGIVVWGMGNVIVLLSKQLVEKQEKNKKSGSVVATILVLLGLSLLSSSTFAQGTTAAASDTSLDLGGVTGMALYTFIAAIIVEIFAIFYLGGVIRNLHRNLFDIKPDAMKESTSLMPNWWHDLDKKVFTKAVPVEKEADVLLDHDYDGIKELDNALPPWWKYGFYVTILVAVVYLYIFHIAGTGKNPTQEYEAQMEDARIAKEKFDAVNKDKVDEKNVPMADKAGLDRGMQIFKTDCFPCHGQLGEGGAGPNLTDDYWLHKGSLNDIFHSIKVGYPDKGMQSWLVKYNEKQISEIASYVKTLHGTNPPNAKAPQGDKYEDVAPAADSTATKKVDSTAVVKK